MATMQKTTVVLGQKREDDSLGRVLWRETAPMAHAFHFRTEALKRFFGGDVNAALLEQKKGTRNLTPKDQDKKRALGAPFVLAVPVYRGADARFATYVKSVVRRRKRREAEKSFLAKVREFLSVKDEGQPA